MIEKIIFNVLAFTLFIILFFKLIRKNDTSYIVILAIEFVGIFLNFMELVTPIYWNIWVRFLMYILAVIIPAGILWLEFKGYPFSEITRLLLARWLIGKDDRQAKQILLNLIEKNPTSYPAHKTLAMLYEKQKNWEVAIDEYRRAVDLRNVDKDSYFKIAQISNEMGNKEEAIKMLNHLLKQRPAEYRATELLGNILQGEERYKEAIGVYQEALRYRPTQYEIYYQLGMAYTMLNDFQKAKEYYEKAADLNSMLYHAKFDIGQIELIMGDLVQAKEHFMECIQNEDTEVGGYYYLAIISILRGHTDNAVNYLNLAIELAGKDGTVYEDMLEEPLFVKIRMRVTKPSNLEKRMHKITKREEKVQRHLAEMYNIVGKLNNSDLEMMKNVKAVEKEEQEQQNSEIEKEY